MMIKNNKIKNMKNLKFFTLAIAILGFSATSFAQTNPTVEASASTSARIIIPISIVKNVDLNFGNIAPSATDLGTVVLSPASSTVRTNDKVSLPTVAGTVAAAKFTVTGEGTSAFNISLPSSITLTGDISGNMTVDHFLSSAGDTPALIDGTMVFYVGATLNVGANQAKGLYTNTLDFIVKVNYN